jgi:hypothetical protein
MLLFILAQLSTAKITTLFQSKEGLFVFEAGKPVRRVMEVPFLCGGEIWALVNGDVERGQPDYGLIDRNIRIVMGSSPKPSRQRCWLWSKNNLAGTYFIKTWTDEELLFVGWVQFFLLLKGNPQS